ncbi:hypothetical protein E2C01_017862 [Portunus trituberculatus]|uniref:Uncharacterized protein n=1 Tax=Portunus trituberculatus TaxID=210409 RepID=A0A5B7DTL7_PORTR|nr:hypothetical protein [Portunus trituberculatus]
MPDTAIQARVGDGFTVTFDPEKGENVRRRSHRQKYSQYGTVVLREAKRMVAFTKRPPQPSIRVCARYMAPFRYVEEERRPSRRQPIEGPKQQRPANRHYLGEKRLATPSIWQLMVTMMVVGPRCAGPPRQHVVRCHVQMLIYAYCR